MAVTLVSLRGGIEAEFISEAYLVFAAALDLPSRICPSVSLVTPYNLHSMLHTLQPTPYNLHSIP